VPLVSRVQTHPQAAPDNSGLLGHFCLTVAHRIFLKKIHSELESVVWLLCICHCMQII
jgi:mediator of RNA polymerase II transcription subunit 17